MNILIKAILTFCTSNQLLNQKYRKIENASFRYAMEKKLNSVNHEKPPTIVKTASIIETIFFWRILKVVTLIFY